MAEADRCADGAMHKCRARAQDLNHARGRLGPSTLAANTSSLRRATLFVPVARLASNIPATHDAMGRHVLV
jgi:hypothetical protein